MEVPTGAARSQWKCHECIKCFSCGTKNNPHLKLKWQDNFTYCAPCYSEKFCHICTKKYRDNEILLKCNECARWQHAHHEMIYSEEEVDSVADQDFKCVGCRPPKKIYRAKLTEKKENETIIDTQGKNIFTKY